MQGEDSHVALQRHGRTHVILFAPIASCSEAMKAVETAQAITVAIVTPR